MSLQELQEEWAEWLEENGFSPISADEIQMKYQLTTPQRRYVLDFEKRWDEEIALQNDMRYWRQLYEGEKAAGLIGDRNFEPPVQCENRQECQKEGVCMYGC